jgi:hypothetical protein
MLGVKQHPHQPSCVRRTDFQVPITRAPLRGVCAGRSDTHPPHNLVQPWLVYSLGRPMFKEEARCRTLSRCR